MLKIGKSYIVKSDGISRLCADLAVDDHKQTLWFGVDSSQEDCLSPGRADPFVMAVLPTAMRGGHEIVCEDAMSERLHYQLCEYLIPSLSFAGDLYRRIHITAPLTAEPYPNRGGVGTVFSGDADSLYTVFQHGSGSECPLTHIAVFNTGALKGSECGEKFTGVCQEAARFADEYGLETVFVDTNLYESLTENLAEVVSFRSAACVFALQSLFSVYLWPAVDAGKFAVDVRACALFDLLTIDCAETEGLTVYPDGAEAEDTEKLAALAQWEPARRLLRPGLLKPPVKRRGRGCAAEHTAAGKKTVKPGAIHIGIPRIEKNAGAVRLCADVDLFGKKEVMWFSVDEKYGEYLVDDRADAFVAGLLTPAMRAGADIICDAPVTRRLLYQLRQYLIPMLAAKLDEFHSIALRAEPADAKLPCENAAATGWTGGVDSMFTLMRHFEAEQPSRRLTHLMIANNGAIAGEDAGATLKKMVHKAENGIAAELGLSVVGIDANIQELVDEDVVSVLVFRHASVVLALQKLFGVYYNSSSMPFSWLRFDAIANYCDYALVVLGCFETDGTSFYLSGGSHSRIQKLRELSDYPLAHRYLHPCIYALPERNCGRCGKCVTTMAPLYALGALDRFSSVFDADLFERDMDWYLDRLLRRSIRSGTDYSEALALLKSRGIEPSFSVRRRTFMVRMIRKGKMTLIQLKRKITKQAGKRA